MGKSRILVLVILLIVFLPSCEKNEKVVSSILSSPTENVNKNTETEKIQPTQDSSLVYRNTKCGYQLVFPESWKGYYVINEMEDGAVRINFFGKSKTGTISLKSRGIEGLPMFIIDKESELEKESPLDSIRKIGTVNGINYYIATGTGSSIASLYDIADVNSAARQTAEYKVDEIELDLAKKDWIKVCEMLKEKDSILKTFSPIK